MTTSYFQLAVQELSFLMTTSYFFAYYALDSQVSLSSCMSIKTGLFLLSVVSFI